MDQENLVKHCSSISGKKDFRLDNLQQLVFREIKDGNLLDVGAGMGHMSLFALRAGTDVTALDISSELLCLLSEKAKAIEFGTLKVVECAAEKMDCLGVGLFDNIVSLDVLEHIKDDVKVIENMHHVLKPGGRVVLVVPAMPSLWSKRDEKYYHFRRYSKDDIVGKLVAAGFVVDKVRYWNFAGACLAMVKKSFGVYFAEDAIRTSNNFVARFVNRCLSVYFDLFENRFGMPFGLNLLVVAHK